MTGPITPGSDPRDSSRYGADPLTPGAGSAGYPAGGGGGADAVTERPGDRRVSGQEPMQEHPGARHLSGHEPMQVPLRQPWNAGIADPGPLGLAGFALTTMVLSVFNTGLMSSANGEAVVLGLALFYGGTAQLLAGMWEFVKGNTFGAVAFTSYGAFWMSFWYLATHVTLLKGNAGHYVGLYLAGWTIFTLYMTIAALRTTGVITGVFVLLTVTFALLTFGDWAGQPNLTHIGGYLGLATAALAWYASFAGVINATFRRTVLPLFPMNP